MGDTASDAKTALTEATSRLDRLETQFKNMGAFPAASNESGTQNNATWNVNAGGVGVWLCATSAVVGVLVAAGAVYVASLAINESRALRVEMAARLEAFQTRHEADVRELRQKDGALQAYINAGKVPAQPRK